MLQLLLTYCRYHRVPGHSDKERKAFDEKFIRLDTRRLCELTSAADRCSLLSCQFCKAVFCQSPNQLSVSPPSFLL